jgi:diadenosine tetraphosphate (Ap4A) HIT family hydrolase
LKNEERIIGECEQTITFIDNYPASPGHTLVIPRRHFATYFEATEDEILAIGKAVQAAKKVLDKEFSPDAYNIGINNGLMAGQRCRIIINKSNGLFTFTNNALLIFQLTKNTIVTHNIRPKV